MEKPGSDRIDRLSNQVTSQVKNYPHYWVKLLVWLQKTGQQSVVSKMKEIEREPVPLT